MIQIVHRHYRVDYHIGAFCSVLQIIWIDYVQKDGPEYRGGEVVQSYMPEKKYQTGCWQNTSFHISEYRSEYL